MKYNFRPNDLDPLFKPFMDQHTADFWTNLHFTKYVEETTGVYMSVNCPKGGYVFTAYFDSPADLIAFKLKWL